MLVVFLLMLSPVGHADPIDADAYAARHALTNGSQSQRNAVRRCLDKWPDNPFDYEHVTFRIISTQVRVFGVGHETSDSTETEYPQLIYVKPAVSVMSGTTYELMNPNGWYCFDTTVNVMGTTTVLAACDAHITDSRDGTEVMGTNHSSEKGGVTVLGKTKVQRVGCE